MKNNKIILAFLLFAVAASPQSVVRPKPKAERSPTRASEDVSRRKLVDCQSELPGVIDKLARIEQRYEESQDLNATEEEMSAAKRVADRVAQKELPFDKLLDLRSKAKECLGLAINRLDGPTQIRFDTFTKALLMIEVECQYRTQQMSIAAARESATKATIDGSARKYAALVADYNSLVAKYNTLLDSTQRYVSEDEKFHELVQAYISKPAYVPLPPRLPPPVRTLNCTSQTFGNSTYTTCGQ